MRGQQLSNAGPSEPVEIMGLEGVPEPGDVLNVVENENRAREVANYRARAKKLNKRVAVAQAPRSKA